MHNIVNHLQRDLGAAGSVPQMVDATYDLVRRSGMDAMIYDFSPVATTPGGDLLTPSHLSYRNVPGDMREMWCRRGYHQHDPVQQMALARSAPFAWSYRWQGPRTALARHLTGEHGPVSAYLHDAGLTCGITVPLHRATGGFATFTVIRKDAGQGFARDADEILDEIGLIGQVMHEATLAHFTPDELLGPCARLSPRERECLALCAEGFTAKEIAERIGRSVPTATLHLKAATAKLGARNRAHAIALALHYNLLEQC